MKFATSFFVLVLASNALAGPLLQGRQDSSDGSPTAIQEGGSSETTTAPQEGPSPTTTPSNGGGQERETTTTPAMTIPTSTSGTSPTPSPLPGDEGRDDTPDDCPPCNEPTPWGSQPVKSPSGRECWCFPGADDATSDGSWSPVNTCQVGSAVPEGPDGMPTLCLGTGLAGPTDVPQTSTCLEACNYMLTTINGLSPCQPNLYNAARSCTGCSRSGALRTTLFDGAVNSAESFKQYLDALSGWCAKPSRCVQLSTGAKISEGQCAAINPPSENDRGRSTTTAPAGPPVGSPGAGRGGSTVPSVIVTSSTITTIDELGRPTLSVQQLTMSNPAFTPNTVFGGSALTGSGIRTMSFASVWTIVSTGILAGVLQLVVGF